MWVDERCCALYIPKRVLTSTNFSYIRQAHESVFPPQTQWRLLLSEYPVFLQIQVANVWHPTDQASTKLWQQELSVNVPLSRQDAMYWYVFPNVYVHQHHAVLFHSSELPWLFLQSQRSKSNPETCTTFWGETSQSWLPIVVCSCHQWHKPL